MSHRENPRASPFSCIGKETHATGQMAVRIARQMKRKGKCVESYRCLFCDLWHVGRRHHLKSASGGRKTR